MLEQVATHPVDSVCMPIVRGGLRVGSSSISGCLVLTSRLFVASIKLDGLTLDTRFTPTSKKAAGRTAVIYFLQSGSITLAPSHPEAASGQVYEGPCALLLSDEHLEGAKSQKPWLMRTSGLPFHVVEVHVAQEELRRPIVDGVFSLEGISQTTWACAQEVARIADTRDDLSAQRAVEQLLDGLAKDGVVSTSLAAHARQPLPRPILNLWRFFRPMLERFYLAPTIQELSTSIGVSLRQAERLVRDFVPSLTGMGWRGSTRHFRIKLAVLLLSCKQTTIGEVAKRVGYGSSDAMAVAFRQANLPSPRALQAALVSS